MSCVLDCVAPGAILDISPSNSRRTPADFHRLIVQTLSELGESLPPDQVQMVSATFQEAGLL